MAAASSTITTATATFLLNPSPNRHNHPISFLSLQPRPTHFPLISSSSSITFSNKLSPLPFRSTFFSASSQDETLVTEDQNDVVVDESQPPQEDAEGTTTEEDDDSVESDGTGVEEPPVTILSSLQSYKEALVENNESKLSEIESYLKSIEDEKLVLERKLATLLDELSNAKDRVLRISADFDNFRKRTERERVSLVANAQGEVVENLLPVLDNFERAKAAIKVENDKEEKINNSYQSIYKQFVEILGSLGVVPVETTGQPFDPLLHEAIMREESTEFEEGVVIQEFRKGFRIGERLLRPSMVKVSAGPGPEKTEPVSPSGADSVEEPEVVDQSESSPALEECYLSSLHSNSIWNTYTNTIQAIEDGVPWYSKLYRHHPRNHPSSPWCFLQVRLSCGILDMCFVDFAWMDPRGYLCHLCHHQVIQLLCMNILSLYLIPFDYN